MTSIKCGNCKGTHAAIADVKSCYSGKAVMTVTAPRPASPAGTQPATEKQISFIRTLAEQRSTAGQQHQENLLDVLYNATHPDAADVDPVTKGEASGLIEWLLTLPKVQAAASEPKASTAMPDVPEGRYAVEDGGTLKFYRVDRPAEGRWAGCTFVKVQASDEWHRIGKESAYKVLEAIAADPGAASTRYGREIGACGVCGRTLTDEASRAAGIGPICASKTGW